MGRRTSGQQVGFQAIGNVQANAATLTTTQTNTDLTLDPNGTGGVVVNGNVTLNAQYDLRLSDSDSSNYIAMQAASSMGSNYTITWPASVSAANGYILSSDSSGNLSWTSPSSLGIAVSDSGSTATVHYPIFGTNGGSLPSTLTPLARSNLSFVPSTGDLRTSIVTGGTASGGNLVLRSTTDSTKGQVYIDETTASTSSTTGALRVGGGVGVTGNINYSGTIQRNTAGGVGSGGSARFGGISSSTKLDIHINSSSGGSSATSTQQYGISFTQGSGNTQAAIVCAENGSDGTAIGFFTTSSYAAGPQWRCMIDNNGMLCPSTNNTFDLGTSSLRWRTIYTTDLELSNGIGDYTVVEGEEDLFIYNNKNGKTYKFLLQEVDKSIVPAKKAGIPGA